MFITFFCSVSYAGTLSDSTTVIINNINIVGNNKTRESVILRELLIKKGDTISIKDIAPLVKRSEENLFNTSLFNYITVNIYNETPKHANLFVLVEERWYLWPYIIFEHADRNLSAFLNNANWSRVNYGIMLVKNNFRGRREIVKIKTRFGYNEQLQFAYTVPNIGGSQRHGVSAELSYNRLHEVAYNLFNDKLIYYNNPDKYMQKYYSAYINYKYRPKYDTDHNLSAMIYQRIVDDTIITLNNNFFYNNNNFGRYFILSYTFNFDTRNYIHYPLTGKFFSLNISKTGLSILPGEPDGFWGTTIDYALYNKLHNRWYSGLNFKSKLTSKSQVPFSMQQSLGYTDYLRSYEYFVINGQHYGIAHAFLKYELMPERIVKIEKFKWNKFNKIPYSFYLNIFTDAGYVIDNYQDPNNNLANKLLISAGIGLDFITYYDQILRFEYSFSKYGVSRFYLHIGKVF